MSLPIARTIDVHIKPTIRPYIRGEIERAATAPDAEQFVRDTIAPYSCIGDRFQGPVPWSLAAIADAPITPVPIPDERVPMSRFFARALPGHTLLHAGRESMLALPGDEPRILPPIEDDDEEDLDDEAYVEEDDEPASPVEFYQDGPTSLLFQSLSWCFARHYPFALRPEVLGYLINHEIAETVRRHPDHYRHLYSTRPSGRESIEVRDDSLHPDRPSDWGRALGLFEGALRAVVPDGIMDAMMPRYSTETPESRVASLIAFMDTAGSYYQFSMLTLCGIPRIRLLGTVADWQTLLASARKLAERFDAHLGTYFEHLLPVLKTIVAQADPDVPVDNEFWSSIYKRWSMSGGDRVTGWITAFVHYLKDANGSLVEKPQAEWRPADVHPFTSGGGITHDAFALHVSTVPFQWNHRGDVRPMLFAGGVLGVDDEDGFVTPALSYAVLHANRR